MATNFEQYSPESFMSGPSELFVPKTANRFVLTVGDIPSFLIKKVTRPAITFGEIVLDHVNTKRKLQGKADWGEVSMTLYDPIVPSGAAFVMDWVRLGYQSATGLAGYPSEYKKQVTVEGLDPAGNICERFILNGAFISSTEMGEYDWSSEAALEITVTMKYDWALWDL
jgi:hypothetical protein|tara:strand:+ start:1043 stop:1549 length:507 start_codon:yes stop_codon:yes gene_type:complete